MLRGIYYGRNSHRACTARVFLGPKLKPGVTFIQLDAGYSESMADTLSPRKLARDIKAALVREDTATAMRLAATHDTTDIDLTLQDIVIGQGDKFMPNLRSEARKQCLEWFLATFDKSRMVGLSRTLYPLLRIKTQAFSFAGISDLLSIVFAWYSASAERDGKTLARAIHHGLLYSQDSIALALISRHCALFTPVCTQGIYMDEYVVSERTFISAALTRQSPEIFDALLGAFPRMPVQWCDIVAAVHANNSTALEKLFARAESFSDMDMDHIGYQLHMKLQQMSGETLTWIMKKSPEPFGEAVVANWVKREYAADIRCLVESHKIFDRFQVMRMSVDVYSVYHYVIRCAKISVLKLFCEWCAGSPEGSRMLARMLFIAGDDDEVAKYARRDGPWRDALNIVYTACPPVHACEAPLDDDIREAYARVSARFKLPIKE
jgi:hypothetical protein